MAKTKYTVTTSWQAVGTGIAVFSVAKKGEGTLLFNETADDATAYKGTPEVGDQFQQTEAKATQVRADGTGWEIVGDGEIV